jgi:hypothetical protein
MHDAAAHISVGLHRLGSVVQARRRDSDRPKPLRLPARPLSPSPHTHTHTHTRTHASTHQNRCAEGEHNDLATLFMSSSHHTIIKLFSMGHAPGQPYVTHFTQVGVSVAQWVHVSAQQVIGCSLRGCTVFQGPGLPLPGLPLPGLPVYVQPAGNSAVLNKPTRHNTPTHRHFDTQGSLALFVVVYLVLMSAGAGVAIPGGLFMPSIIVSVVGGWVRCARLCVSCRGPPLPPLKLHTALPPLDAAAAGWRCVGRPVGLHAAGVAAALEHPAGRVRHHGGLKRAGRRV